MSWHQLTYMYSPFLNESDLWTVALVDVVSCIYRTFSSLAMVGCNTLSVLLSKFYKWWLKCWFVHGVSCLCCVQEYLARLEAIRRQNFEERRKVSRRAAAAVYHPHVPMVPSLPQDYQVPTIYRVPMTRPKPNQEMASLRTFDPEERRRKVAALKVLHSLYIYM